MLTGLNFVTTFHRMRDKAMGPMQIPLFTWSLYATAWVQILATPVIAITFVLVVLERFLSIGLFEPDKGGDPLLYQHLFWMYSHPAVYIIILPAMGSFPRSSRPSPASRSSATRPSSTPRWPSPSPAPWYGPTTCTPAA